LSSKLAELRELLTERESFAARIAERDARIAERDARVRELLARNPDEAERLARRVSELEVELAVAREQAARVGTVEAELGAIRSSSRRLEAEVSERDRKIALLEQELADSLSWSAPPADDLTRIKGIGPKSAQTLKQNGVMSFAQIASWTAADVEQIAPKLKLSPARIAKSGWVEAARALLKR
jgi:predicted flap endonuclease-1-like 5' DNA nuclease